MPGSLSFKGIDTGKCKTWCGNGYDIYRKRPDEKRGAESGISEGNLPEIIETAEKYSVRIAIENCPMLFGPDQWPGGQNLMTTPAVWKKVFEILPSEYLGLNYDPSHFVWQMIDI